jgi:hypothetical protein
VAAWYQLCLKYKKKKVIERIYGLHFEGSMGIKNLKAAIHLKANGIGHKIPTQQDLVKRTLEDPAFKDLSFWPPSESPPVTPEPMVVAPEASSEPPTRAEEASVPPHTNFNHPASWSLLPTMCKGIRVNGGYYLDSIFDQKLVLGSLAYCQEAWRTTSCNIIGQNSSRCVSCSAYKKHIQRNDRKLHKKRLDFKFFKQESCLLLRSITLYCLILLPFFIFPRFQ